MTEIRYVARVIFLFILKVFIVLNAFPHSKSRIFALPTVYISSVVAIENPVHALALIDKRGHPHPPLAPSLTPPELFLTLPYSPVRSDSASSSVFGKLSSVSELKTFESRSQDEKFKAM